MKPVSQSLGAIASATLLSILEWGITNPVTAQTLPAAPAVPLQLPNLTEDIQHLVDGLNETQLPETPSSSFPFLLPDSLEMDPMGQITNTSQLRDVFPGDWAYQALRDLVDRYDCLAGYPDGTFRGDRATSRYEFAAGLNACSQQIERLLAEAAADLARGEDLEILQRLQAEFALELADLDTRTDALEAQVANLEDLQFSTTTKLFGQAIVGLQGRSENTFDFFPVDGVGDLTDPFDEVNLITNVQLSLLTQFSPRSLLLTGISAGDGSTSPFRFTNDNRLSYEGDTDNQLQLSDLTYRHLFGDRVAVIAGVRGVNAVSVFRGANRVESAGFGPISFFAQRNPIVNIGAGSGGLGFDWQVSDRFNIQGVYSSSLPANSAFGGLFGGDFGDTTTAFQFAVAPTNTLDLTFNYIHAYSPEGTIRTGVGDDRLILDGTPLKTNAFGSTIAWRLSPRMTLGGWVGYTTSTAPGQSGRVNTLNWMAFLNFPDLLGEGNLGGIYVGQPPKITSSTFPDGFNIPNLLAGGTGTAGGQSATTTHVEAFYRLRLTDNIAITPGTVLVFNPGHSTGSDTIAIGALRMTLTF